MEYPLLQLQTEFDNVAVATARVDPQLLFEIQIKVNLISKAASAKLALQAHSPVKLTEELAGQQAYKLLVVFSIAE